MAAVSPPQLQIEELRERGFVVVPGFVPAHSVAELKQAAGEQLAARVPPLELEADLKYPGAPASRSSAGGETVRRLLDAYVRDSSFAACATGSSVREWMEAYFAERVLVSRTHHNCLMTKHPFYGSLTGWHRDIRFWEFAREDLVSMWVALGDETVENGGLWFVPGSHTHAFDAGRFDAARFFRADHPENATLLRTAISPRLAAGDVVFFHSNTLHSAGTNRSDAVKFSLVFSYHGQSNTPKPGTRSSSKPEIALRPS